MTLINRSLSDGVPGESLSLSVVFWDRSGMSRTLSDLPPPCPLAGAFIVCSSLAVADKKSRLLIAAGEGDSSSYRWDWDRLAPVSLFREQWAYPTEPTPRLCQLSRVEILWA